MPASSDSMVDRARRFAIEAHADQSYGPWPYSHHLDAVAQNVKSFGVTAQAIAYLHDVVEDTSTTTEDVEQTFGPLVAECVRILTDEPGKTRAERKARTYAKMAKVHGDAELALIVKAADRLANVLACVATGHEKKMAMYRNEQPAFRKAVHRPELCDELWEKLEAAFSDG